MQRCDCQDNLIYDVVMATKTAGEALMRQLQTLSPQAL